MNSSTEKKNNKAVSDSDSSTIDALYKMGLILFIILIAAFFYLRTENAIDVLMKGGYSCAFRRTTGFLCPGCGGTRASLYLARLRIVDSFKMNAAVPIGAAMYIIFMAVETSHKLFNTNGIKEKHFYIMLTIFAVTIIVRWVLVNFII